jgi:hypothetical protein
MEKSVKAELSAIRRRRLAELVRRYKDEGKTQRELELDGGFPAGYVSLALTGRKNLGEMMVKRAEQMLRLSDGWFSRETDTGPAYNWPFKVELERITCLNAQDLAMVEGAMVGVLQSIEQRQAPRKKPGGGGGKGGGAGGGGGGAGGGGSAIPNVPGSTTKHAPLTLVRLTPEEQQSADELALRRAKKPATSPKPHPVDPNKPTNRDLFEK